MVRSFSLVGIGAFTVTSFAVSRGRLESLVGKRFVAGGLCVYFAGILSLFQGSKFVVAMVANATMFSHLLPGCSSGSKHLLLL